MRGLLRRLLHREQPSSGLPVPDVQIFHGRVSWNLVEDDATIYLPVEIGRSTPARSRRALERDVTIMVLEAGTGKGRYADAIIIEPVEKPLVQDPGRGLRALPEWDGAEQEGGRREGEREDIYGMER